MTRFQYCLVALGLVALGVAGCVLGSAFHSTSAIVVGCSSALVGIVIVL